MPPKRPTARRRQLSSTLPAAGLFQLSLPFLFPFLQPAAFAIIACCKESPQQAATRKYPPFKSPQKVDESSNPSTKPAPRPRSKAECLFIKASSSSATCESQASARRQESPVVASRFETSTQSSFNDHRPRVVERALLNSETDFRYHKARRRARIHRLEQLRSAHSATRRSTKSSPPSREEFLSLIDMYGRESYSTQAYLHDTSGFSQMTIASPYGRRLGPLEAGLDIGEYREFRTVLAKPTGPILPYGPVFGAAAKARSSWAPALLHMYDVLNSEDCTHERAFEAYCKIPKSSLADLEAPLIRLLLRRLSVVDKKSSKVSLQFLSVVEEMTAKGICLTNGEWNSAISFCGQTFNIVREEDVERAISLWKRMEQEANIEAGVTTFNILFDIAAKAGKFVLADMILQEMQGRNLELNRYSRVSKIYFYGLKRDPDGIRQAYRELVEAGEAVDTVVLNCLIAALIAADEPASAEHVYRRMTDMLTARTDRCGFPSSGSPEWQEARDLGRLYDFLGRARREGQDHPLRRHLEDNLTFAPDMYTYSTLIEYHASESGDLQAIASLLAEMKAFDVPLHGRIFLKLFKGFSTHGARMYTDWTSLRLKTVYRRLLDALDAANDKQQQGHWPPTSGTSKGVDGRGNEVVMQRWLVIWAVRAFDECAGHRWAMHVWHELRARWQPDELELQRAAEKLERIIR